MEIRKNSLGSDGRFRDKQSADKTGRSTAGRSAQDAVVPRKRYFLSVRQVASRWNLSERSVWRFLELKQLPTYRFGAARRILEADVEKFENERLIETG